LQRRLMLGEILLKENIITPENLQLALKQQKRYKIGELLVKKGLITESILNEALEQQKKTSQQLGEILAEMGKITEENIADVVAEQEGYERVNISQEDNIDLNLIKSFDENYMRHFLVIPFQKQDEKLRIVIQKYYNYRTIDYIKDFYKVKEIEICIGTEKEILTFLDKHFTYYYKEEEEYKEDLDDEEFDIMSTESPLVKYVNNILEKAVRENTSDIHVEPQFNQDSVIRFRIDGTLYAKSKFPRSWHKQVVSRLKILSKLDIAKQFEPQDGEIRFKINNGYINMRVSTIPTINGEKMVIRLLGSGTSVIDLENLQLTDENRNIIITALNKRRGMILITAPTGEGKTTTLYASLNYLNSEGVNSDINIVTIEDPVEIRLPGTNQIKVSPNISYAQALRAILRQDPNVIMLGEIRDNETADIAVKASITGHLVLSTLHTTDTYGVIARLLNMGVPAYLIADSLELVIAQRLVKKLCSKCCVDDDESIEFIKSIHPKIDLSKAQIKKPQGCSFCDNLGHDGRIAVFEFLQIDTEIRDYIAISDIRSIREQKKAVKTMYEDGLEKVLQGKAHYDELLMTLGISKNVLKFRKI